MRQYSILKNVVRGVNFGVAVKSAGSIKYYGWSDKGIEWAQWANSNNASLDQLPVGVSAGEFSGMSDEVMKSIILSSADAALAGQATINTKKLSFAIESQSIANISKYPSLVDKPLPIEPRAKNVAVKFKVRNFKQSIIQGEVAFKVRTHQLAFNNETNSFNAKPNRASQHAARHFIQANMSTGTERKFGQRINHSINKQIIQNSGGLVIKRDIIGQSTKEILDVFTKGRLGYAIGRSLGGAARAITPNRGRSRARGLAQRFIGGDMDPRTRRDVDGDGMIFDGTWREMPDPTRFTDEAGSAARRGARSMSAAVPPYDGTDDGSGPKLRRRRLGMIDTRGSKLASRITYDLDNGDTVVYYRDGRVEEFAGVPYETARRASVDGTADRMIRQLEKSNNRKQSGGKDSQIGNLKPRRSSSFSDIINEISASFEPNENPELEKGFQKAKRGVRLTPEENKLVMSKLNDEKNKRKYANDSRIDDLIDELKSRENIGKEKDSDRGARSSSGDKEKRGSSRTWNLQDRVRKSKTPMDKRISGPLRKPKGTRGEERTRLRRGTEGRSAASRSRSFPDDSRISRAPMIRLREGKVRRPRGTRGEERSRLRQTERSAASRSTLPDGFDGLGFSASVKDFAGVGQGDDFDGALLRAQQMDGVDRNQPSETTELVAGVISTLSAMDFNESQTVPEQRKMIKEAIAETIERMGLRMSVEQTKPLENYLAAINGGLDADAASALRALESGGAPGVSANVYAHRANVLEAMAAYAFKKIDVDNPESIKEYEASRGFKAKYGPALDATINRYLYSDLGRSQLMGEPLTDSEAARELNGAKQKLLAAGPFNGDGADLSLNELLYMSSAIKDLLDDSGENSPLRKTMDELFDIIQRVSDPRNREMGRRRRAAPGKPDTEQVDPLRGAQSRSVSRAIENATRRMGNNQRGARSSSNPPDGPLGNDLEDAIATVLKAKRGETISRAEAINARTRLRLLMEPDADIDIDENERVQLMDFVRTLDDIIDGGRGAQSSSYRRRRFDDDDDDPYGDDGYDEARDAYDSGDGPPVSGRQVRERESEIENERRAQSRSGYREPEDIEPTEPPPFRPRPGGFVDRSFEKNEEQKYRNFLQRDLERIQRQLGNGEISLDEAELQREAVFRQWLAEERVRKAKRNRGARSESGGRGARSESDLSRSMDDYEVDTRFNQQVRQGKLTRRRMILSQTVFGLMQNPGDMFGRGDDLDRNLARLSNMQEILAKGGRLSSNDMSFLAGSVKNILMSPDVNRDDRVTFSLMLDDFMRNALRDLLGDLNRKPDDGGGSDRGARSSSGPNLDPSDDINDAIMIIAKARRGEPVSEEEATLVAARMELLMAPDANVDINEDERVMLLDLYKEFENIIKKGGSGRGARSSSNREFSGQTAGRSRWNVLPKDYVPTDSDIEDAIVSIVKLKAGEKITNEEAAMVLQVLDTIKGPDSLIPLDENQRIEILDLIKTIQTDMRGAQSRSTRRGVDDPISTRMSRANVSRASSPRGARSASSAARTPVAIGLENRRLNFTELEGRLGREDNDGDGGYFNSLSDAEKAKVEGAVGKAKEELTKKLKETFEEYWEAQSRGAKKQSIRAAKQRAKGTGGRYAPRPADSPITADDVEEMTLRLIDAVNAGTMQMFEKDKTTGELIVDADGNLKLRSEFLKVQKLLDNMLAILNMEEDKDFSRLEHLSADIKKLIAKEVGKADTDFTKAQSSITRAGGGYEKLLPKDLASDQELGKGVKLSVGKRVLRTNPRREARALARSRRLNRSGFRTGAVIDPKLQIAQRKLRFQAAKRKMLARFTKTKDAEVLSADLAERKKELTPISVDNKGVVKITPQYIDMLAILSGDKTAAKARKKLSQKDYDKLLYDLWENSGFSDEPLLVDEDQIATLIAAGWQPIIRGTGAETVNSETYVEQFLTSPGRFIPGQGARAYGVGEYFRIAGTTAWAGFDGGPNDRHSIVGLIPPSADIVSVDELRQELGVMRNLTNAIIEQEKIAGGREVISKMTPGEFAEMAKRGLPDLNKETSRSGQIVKQMIDRLEELDKQPDSPEKIEETRKIIAAINYLDDFTKQSANSDSNVGYFAPIIGVDGIDTNSGSGTSPSVIDSPFLLHNRSMLVAFLAPTTRSEANRMTKKADGTIAGNVWRTWKTRPDRSRETSAGGALVRSRRGRRRRATDGDSSATPTPTPTATPASVTPKSGIVVDTWNESNPPSRGSNPATMLTDPMGTKYYTKLKKAGESSAEALERMETEVLAGKLYELAGVPVADLQMGTRGGQPVMLSRMIQTSMPSGRSDNDAARQNFVVDAWLANWDAPLNDNIKIDSNGRAVRLDVGGSLDYRAQGAKKGSGGTVAFGPKVGEMTSLQKRGNVDFSNMDREEIRRQALGLSTITDDMIRQQVSAIVTDPARAKMLADTLIARRDDIVANWSK